MSDLALGEEPPPWRTRISRTAAEVVDLARSRPATLGQGRLVCVDGPAGSGKSTLGEAVHRAASAEGTSTLVHLDDLLDGWGGLGDVATTLEHSVLLPLCDGRRGSYRRYDWHREQFAEEHPVDPVDLLVVEGVGSGASTYAELVTVLVWVEAPDDVRLARGLARDGEGLRPQWERWMVDEAAMFARERTRERADVVVSGDGSRPPRHRWRR